MIEDITLHEGELTNIPLSIKRQRFLSRVSTYNHPSPYNIPIF